MERPIIKYQYSDWIVRTYDDWVEQVNEQNDCLLKSEYTQQLEMIYKNEEYTEEQHKKNIEFLEDLQKVLAHVWSHSIREKAKMSNLIEDYKEYYGIMDAIY